MDEATLRQAARDLLRRFGPMSPADLLGQLRADGLDTTMADDPGQLRRLLLDELEDGSFAAFPLVDGRLCDLDDLIDGLTLTHVVTDEERADGSVAFAPDLTALHLVSPDGRTIPRADGGTATLDRGSRLRLGEAAGLPAEPVLVVRLEAGRMVVSGRDESPVVDPTTAHRLEQTLDTVRAAGRGAVDEVELLVEARARYPRLLDEPGAPLSALLDAVGLRSTDHGVLLADEAEPDPADAIDGLTDHLRADHGLGEREVTAVLRVYGYVQRLQHDVLEAGVRAMRDRIDAGEPAVVGDHEALDEAAEAAVTGAALEALDGAEVGGELALVLDDVEPAMALVEDVVGTDPLAASCLLALLQARPPASRSRAVRANSAWVRARLLEFVADDHAAAETELRRARELDEGHGPATFDLARYLDDRGQAGAALGLLRRIEGPDVEETIDLLAPYAEPGPASAGRNDPCPCGSGRKYKVCCQARGGWPLAERLDWIWHKVMRFVASPYARELVEPIAAACGRDPADPSIHHIAVLNLSLFDGGLLEEFADVRGSLLPADELALVRRWSEVRAGFHELVEIDADATCTALDLRTGERVRFVDRSMASSLSVGDAVLAWLIPAPDDLAPSYGAIVVPDRRRGDLLELLDDDPDATELAAWYASLSAPPTLATTAGDPLVMTTSTYAVDDVEAARTALAQHLEDDGELLTAFEERDGQRWSKGTVEFDEEGFTIATTSRPRAAWFAELVAEVVPAARLVDEERLPVGDLLGRDAVGEDGDEDELGPGGDDGLLDLDDLDPGVRSEVEEQLEAFMVQHEDAWVDTPLPALEGATPRQAADDPTRRQQLERLLDEMETTSSGWTGPGRGMDARRLRGLLGW